MHTRMNTSIHTSTILVHICMPAELHTSMLTRAGTLHRWFYVNSYKNKYIHTYIYIYIYSYIQFKSGAFRGYLLSGQVSYTYACRTTNYAASIVA